MALPDIIPVEELFNPPGKLGASISPDGTLLAYLAPWKNRLNVWVQSLDSDTEARCVTADETRSVTNFQWAGDQRWLLYFQDTGGDENHHVFRVDLTDSAAPAVDLTPFPKARVVGFEQPPGRPGKALLQLNNRDVAEFDLLELDIASGELTVLAENPGHVTSWLHTPDGELFARTLSADGDIVVSRWKGADGQPEPIAVFDGIDYPLDVAPFELAADGTGVWIGSSRDRDLTRLARLDLTTGEETEVDSHPTLELDGVRRAVLQTTSPLIRSRGTGELLGVRYLGERQVIQAVDPDFAVILERLTALSEGDLGEMSSDRSGQRWVVSFLHDRQPGATWFYDHATGRSRLLFTAYPNLDPETLAPMVPVTITARDGRPLPSYLTLPVGIEPVGLPLVLLPHGGPWARDFWNFKANVQLLANRGYAVLQVNFRGSVGYGKAHMQAAIGEFAGAMHHDLVDAVEWAVARGYADPKRLGIFGGSYGGYATLVGVTFTPDLFAAAIDYVGISNLATFMQTLPSFVKYQLINNWFRYVGDPDDPEQYADMLARSPISRVDQIRTPLMVVQGANDVRVVKAESDNIVEALRARGVDVEYLVKNNEGHGFVNPENQIDMFRRVERFLAQHLGGRQAEG
ncbi:S9 family peptidase [Actinoalloteichus hymeniacidonis]|uniref:Dipeptidyl aminopeptidase/acylaminoacyl peptidase n=1 Tax=Actinoalloteichus hymeniacidonis TaxID=340345 RepID=A0AAC9HML8_9PSEU|nr:S9 family peptidase [Actinoalloteichus hymeniacidonis]AOS61923.1 dipeptidyl aminopeptidase/acylaminoacyl peptidase [Actinoalloteichus hymeniacidonis]MBB5910057.1 dipeptidyl aminopeptidase/acylaminoacyl peptidase [Actinoalloteichus hymeniacidonis]